MERLRTGISALLSQKATKLTDLLKTLTKRKQFPQQGNKDRNSRQENRNLYNGTFGHRLYPARTPNIKTICSIPIAVPSPPELTTAFVKGVAAFFSLSLPSPALAPTSPGSSHAWNTCKANSRTTTPYLLTFLVY
jgi:hypothetical protein